MAPIRWPPDQTDAEALQHAWPHPPMLVAIGRGLAAAARRADRRRLFDGFLRVVPACSNCTAPLGLARADDAPPYFTILIVGHIIIPLLYMGRSHGGAADLADDRDLPASDVDPVRWDCCARSRAPPSA